MNNTEKLHEECGVFAICDPAGDVARTTYYALYALQHRGQESCGIAINNNRDIYYHKDMGLVNEVFNEQILSEMEGTMALGHVRYSTKEQSLRENAQPLVIQYIKGNLAIAYNGTLINGQELRSDLCKDGAFFQTTADAESIAYLISRYRVDTGSIEAAVEETVKHLKGAFALIVMSARKMIAVRDKWGLKPLSIGKNNDALMFSSETCALDSIGAEFVRDVEPGEIVVIEDGKLKSSTKYADDITSNMCIFEYLYMARPDSMIEGQMVHDSRKLAGAYLWEENPIDADVVIGVPDSGLSAAIGYSERSGIPYGTGFIKNRYIGRTFIQPIQSMRENSVKIKLNVLKSTVEGKRVVMVDDSIVRGTTCKRIVSLLRKAGAAEVHVRSSAPAFLYPCYFGTDVPSQDQLIACKHSMEEIREMIGADTLGFLSIENLLKIAPNAHCNFCTGCFTGKYPIDIE